jgi:hypothetical protein
VKVDFLSRLLSSSEVDEDPRLKMIAATLLLYFYVTFYNWWHNSVSLSTRGTDTFDYAPTWLFRDSRWLIFLDNYQTKVYLYVLGMLALIALLALFYLRSSTFSLTVMAFLWCNKLLFYLMDLRLFANFHHLHLFYTLLFLVSASKLRFFRLTLAFSYFASGFIKLTPSWLHGEYFNSIPGKLPLLPKDDWIVTAASAGVILLEFLGPLCWLSRKAWVRYGSVALFVLFHVYSGLLVGFKYTTLMLPLVLSTFLRFDQPLMAGYHYVRRDLVPWSLLSLSMLGSVYHFLLPGDVRLTGEGKYFGVFMFDANRAVLFEAEIQRGTKKWVLSVRRPWRNGALLDDGTLDEDRVATVTCAYYDGGQLVRERKGAGPVRDGGELIFNPHLLTGAQVRTFGDPYLYWFFAREVVQRIHPDRMAIRLYAQLDGHTQMVKVVDIPDFVQEQPDYHPLVHNDWILLPTTESLPQYQGP